MQAGSATAASSHISGLPLLPIPKACAPLQGPCTSCRIPKPRTGLGGLSSLWAT